MPRRYRICGEAEYRRSREQNKFICIAEALQYMRRSRISQKPGVAEPRRYRICGEAEYRRSREQNKFICIAEALQDMRRSPNIAEAGTKSDTGAVAQPNAARPYITQDGGTAT